MSLELSASLLEPLVLAEAEACSEQRVWLAHASHVGDVHAVEQNLHDADFSENLRYAV